MPSKRPDISGLNKRITFLKQTQGKDSYGAPTMVYKEVTSCWASVESQQLKEFITTYGTELQNIITFLIRSKQRVPITDDMMISFQGQKYKIVEIQPDLKSSMYDLIVAKAVS
ncbi:MULTISPECIES: phage head closure protein [Bacillus]|uniref:Phage head-tail adaptor protein n=1 Tax=Bacillus subtilis subsp. subtilis NCIB 3610 = ATCC 6051 = DSM 10 TaxID=535026 RepID=S5DW11_BACIU|nr:MULTISPECIES: phage head closure protein [Bacillus]AGQ21259.1 phage head-tail adaptor protein [Bacillus subtilis subsp. subtilis NCIB 3610 = ATCC 6051 = DSM 10]AQZ93171.1 phage head-tail joining protein [Bacillus subtilis]KNB75942.1 hypothetical protein ACR57_21165 [Bacillus subtilis]MBA4562917.1 phage head closure protein [Bacillus subtilis subsp. subtilis]MBF8228397.1 phage head closure protein [Bacillus subtilis]